MNGSSAQPVYGMEYVRHEQILKQEAVRIRICFTFISSNINNFRKTRNILLFMAMGA